MYSSVHKYQDSHENLNKFDYNEKVINNSDFKFWSDNYTDKDPIRDQLTNHRYYRYLPKGPLFCLTVGLIPLALTKSTRVTQEL